MTLQYFFSDVCTYLAIIPAAIFCFLPAKQYMKWSSRSVILAFSLLFILMVPAGVCLGFFFHLDDNITVGIMIIIFFIGYNRLLTTRFSQNLNMFCLCIALMAFCSNFARGFDALLHPDAPANSFSLEACAFSIRMQYSSGSASWVAGCPFWKQADPFSEGRCPLVRHVPCFLYIFYSEYFHHSP